MHNNNNRNDVLLSESQMILSNIQQMTDPNILTSQALLNSANQNPVNASCLDAQQMTTCESSHMTSLKMFQLNQHFLNLQQQINTDALKAYWQQVLSKYPSFTANDQRAIRMPFNMNNSLVTPEISPYICHLPLSYNCQYRIPMECYGVRRKNATRETTSALKIWLNDHQKNPYPTKNEKIMLSFYTKMSMTQVSTWFANARRRLKKENKMTWTPRSNKPSDSDESDAEGLSDGNDEESSNRIDHLSVSDNAGDSLEYTKRKNVSVDVDQYSCIKMSRPSCSSCEGIREDSEYQERDFPYNLRSSQTEHVRKRKFSLINDEQITQTANITQEEVKKPKIWSIASEIDVEENITKHGISDVNIRKPFAIPSDPLTIPPLMQSYQQYAASNQLIANTYMHRPNFLSPYPFSPCPHNSIQPNFHHPNNPLYNNPMFMPSHYPLVPNSFESMPMFLPMMNFFNQNIVKDGAISDREEVSYNFTPSIITNDEVKINTDDKIKIKIGPDFNIPKAETSVNGRLIQDKNESETPIANIETNLKINVKAADPNDFAVKADERSSILQTKMHNIKNEPVNPHESSIDADTIQLLCNELTASISRNDEITKSPEE